MTLIFLIFDNTGRQRFVSIPTRTAIKMSKVEISRNCVCWSRCKTFSIHLKTFRQNINSPALDWIQTDGSGAYRYGYSTGDKGRHYHVQSATPDNTVSGKFGYKDPGTGKDLQTTYTAGRRGFRARGPHIARRMDLSQTRPPFSRPVDDGKYHPEYDNIFDPNEDRGYDFTYRTSNHIKEEHANRVGDVQGRYSYLDDIGIRHNVHYTAGSRTGFVVSNPVPDTFAQARGGPLYYVGKSGGSKVRGFSAFQKDLNGAYRFLASGPDHKRSEISDSFGNRKGIYTYLDDKGIQHTVEYIAGPKIGYKVINNKKGVNYNPIFPFFPDTPTVLPLFPLPSNPGSSGFSTTATPITTPDTFPSVTSGGSTGFSTPSSSGLTNDGFGGSRPSVGISPSGSLGGGNAGPSDFGSGSNEDFGNSNSGETGFGFGNAGNKGSGFGNGNSGSGESGEDSGGFGDGNEGSSFGSGGVGSGGFGGNKGNKGFGGGNGSGGFGGGSGSGGFGGNKGNKGFGGGSGSGGFGGNKGNKGFGGGSGSGGFGGDSGSGEFGGDSGSGGFGDGGGSGGFGGNSGSGGFDGGSGGFGSGSGGFGSGSGNAGSNKGNKGGNRNNKNKNDGNYGGNIKGGGKGNSFGVNSGSGGNNNFGGGSTNFGIGGGGNSFSSTKPKPINKKPPSNLFTPSENPFSAFGTSDKFGQSGGKFPSSTFSPSPTSSSSSSSFGSKNKNKIDSVSPTWSYDFDYFFSDPSTSNKDWSKPIKGGSQKPSSTPKPSGGDSFSGFSPSPFPEVNIEGSSSFGGGGLSTAESGTGLKPSPVGGTIHKNVTSIEIGQMPLSGSSLDTSSGDDKEEREGGGSGGGSGSGEEAFFTTGSKQDSSKQHHHHYKGHKGLSFPSRGTVKFKGIKTNDWHKITEEDGYISIPPGVAVRAHVQSLDIVPFHKKYLSPGEALHHHHHHHDHPHDHDGDKSDEKEI
ncbi:conserved hypothetical protein [Pediculus humanus corporis]|uniref:Uncharacterized protein n=1 Tax=Pediculus humanus subsp. corporis TaxID=121224 RepID=E0W372_PEDHC|nr:uncharacterized protein Phum_PHUM601680 [Pediculus humanus corporis]EEB20078.1 conserved hypothetical protein [Pediculus humanus corporis]